jgi:hypothetical protein
LDICIILLICQTTILKEDLPGFVFESNRGARHTFTSETAVDKDNALPPVWWAESGSGISATPRRGARKHRSKVESAKTLVRKKAKDIWENHFAVAQNQTRGIVASLRKILGVIEEVCYEQVLFNFKIDFFNKTLLKF